MEDAELIEWLEENSSGIYRPAYDAAQRIKQLKEDIRTAMHKIDMNEDSDSMIAYDILKSSHNQAN